MELTCPNCTNRMQKGNWWDRVVVCNRCGNEWVCCPKYCNSDYIEMINTEIEKLAISEEDYSTKIGFNVNEFKKILVEYDYFDKETYEKLATATNKTIAELTESVLIKVEDYEGYRLRFLKRLNKRKEIV